MPIGSARPITVLPFANISAAAVDNSTTLIMDADGEMLAVKYWPLGTSPITDVDLMLGVTGDTSGINLRIRLESDSNNAPSGTVLGATNNAISGEFTHLASGFTGLKALAESSGNLTVNTPIWIVFYRSSGSSLSGSNCISWRGIRTSFLGQTYTRHHNGTNWTTTFSESGIRCGYVCKHSDLAYSGVPFSNAYTSPSGATDIYGTYRHGVRMKLGSQARILGCWWFALKTGSPNALVVSVFEGAVSKYTNTIPATSITNNLWMPLYFSSPVLVAANANIYLTLKQESNGGSDSADYDTKVHIFPSAYRECAIPVDTAFVYGTGDDPTGYTVSDTDLPLLLPIIADPATDLDEAAGGGGAVGPWGMIR